MLTGIEEILRSIIMMSQVDFNQTKAIRHTAEGHTKEQSYFNK